MNDKMKAIVETACGQTEYRDVAVPQIGDDDILLEVKAAALCGGDMHSFLGHQEADHYPIVMGHEFSAVIAAKGKNVGPRWQVGDRVMSENTGGACGVCKSCAEGNFVQCAHRKTMGFDVDGCFTKYVKLPGSLLKLYPNCLFHLPDNLSFEEATGLEAASNSYMAVVQEGEIKSGETVVVFGCGPLGLMAMAQADIAGAARIIAVGMSGDRKVRFDICKQYGVRYCLAADEEEDLTGHILDICGEDGVDLVIDAAGVPSVTKQAVSIVKYLGKIVRIGYNARPLDMSLDDIVTKSIRLIGHHGYNTVSWRNTIALAACGKLSLKPLITHVMPMSEYQNAIEMMNSQDVGKAVFLPED